MPINKSLAPGGGTRYAVSIQKDSTSQEKKVSTNVIREKQLLALQDEIDTLSDRNKELEDELEEANDVIYRLVHGLPVDWREP
jgi:predicted  nucleic acid-binding Zn-ribbon protein